MFKLVPEALVFVRKHELIEFDQQVTDYVAARFYYHRYEPENGDNECQHIYYGFPVGHLLSIVVV